MDEQLKEQARLLDRKLEEQSRSFAKKFDENDKKIEEMMKLMRVFNAGDWGWLKFQPYKQSSMQGRSNLKLTQKYYGPFRVVDCIGKVAYKLQLPVDAKIHDVFHVSQLKAFYGDLPVSTTLPDWSLKNGKADLYPEAILETRMVKLRNAAQVQYLVQWKNQPTTEVTWEVAEEFVQHFPEFPIVTKT